MQIKCQNVLKYRLEASSTLSGVTVLLFARQY